MKKTIYLFRHGEVEDQYRSCCKGSLDCELSYEGKQMMEANIAYLTSKYIDGVITTGLRRTDLMGQILSERHGIPHEVMRDLREIEMGSWEGRDWEEIGQKEPDTQRMFFQNPLSVHIQDAENPEAFHDRVIKAWQEILRREFARLAIVSHSVTNSVILGHVKYEPSVVNQHAAALNIIEIDGSTPKLVIENKTLYK